MKVNQSDSTFSVGGLILDYAVGNFDRIAAFQPVINGKCGPLECQFSQGCKVDNTESASCLNNWILSVVSWRTLEVLPL